MLKWLRPRPALEEAEVDRGLKMLLYDGAFGQSMLVLTTGAFLVAFALLLGASNKVIGLLAAVGPVAQILQVPAIFLVERLRWRKAITVAAVTVSRLSLLGIAAAPWVVPSRWVIPLFLALLLVYFGMGAVGGCAFNSWFRDLVPEKRMSSFLASRLTWATFLGAVLSFLGGYGLDLYKDHFSSEIPAYSILFVLGCIFGMLSTFFLIRTPEPAMPAGESISIRKLITQPMRDRNYSNLLIFLGAWNFAVNFAAPFFAVYLISRLGLNMAWVLGLSVLSQMFNVMFFGVWGRLADRFTNRSVLMFSVPLFFFSFLLWPFTTLPNPHVLTLPLLVAIHVLSGISTAGVALCAGNLAFKAAPFGRAASYLAVNALVSGVAATVAPILAGFAADWFDPYELRLTLTWGSWQNGTTEFSLPTIDLRGLDFVFIIAFFLGMYSFHRLLAVRERGELTDRALLLEFLGEMRRMVRQVSTVAGMRQLLAFPFPITGTERREAEEPWP